MTLIIAAQNWPHRLAHKNPKHGFQVLADKGADIICAEEHADVDDWSPRGWKRYRGPKDEHGNYVAQSTTLYFNPDAVKPHRRGHVQMSSPHFHEHRGLTWVQFTTEIGPLRVAAAHPPAFKTSRRSHAIEYRKQMVRMANWLKAEEHRAIAGDINGVIPSSWTRPLSQVGRWSDPVPSGPHAARIDYLGVNKKGPYKVSNVALVPGGSDHKGVLVKVEKR